MTLSWGGSCRSLSAKTRQLSVVTVSLYRTVLYRPCRARVRKKKLVGAKAKPFILIMTILLQIAITDTDRTGSPLPSKPNI